MKNWRKRKQELDEESMRLDEWSKRLDKKKLIIEKLRVVCEILPNSADQEEVIKDLDALLERYK